MTTGTVQYGYARTALGQLHYAEAGEGPAVLLLHQTPRSLDEYAELMPLIAAAGHRAVAMDMYGFGQSAKPEGPQSIEQFAAGVAALADALGLDRFAVMGHHTGAVVAIEVAASHPERVSAVVLSSPAYSDAAYRAAHANGPGVDEADIADDGSHLTTLWGLRAPYYPGSRPDLLDRFIRDALAPGVVPAEGHLACARYVMEERIGLVAAPALVIGASDDPFALPDVARVADALEHAAVVQVAVIEGGTIPLLEHKSAEVAAVVLPFLGERSRS
jgi:pimeloyl-ACP methyl ester carboxylesterase